MPGQLIDHPGRETGQDITAQTLNDGNKEKSCSKKISNQSSAKEKSCSKEIPTGAQYKYHY